MSDPGARIESALASGLEAGLFTAATLDVSHTRRRVLHIRRGDPTWFDLASLTKPLAVGTLMAKEFSAGALAPSQTLASVWPDAIRRPTASLRLDDLLAHRSGLTPFRPWHETAADADALLRAVANERPESTPGSTTRYSDAGYILLGAALSSAGRSLADTFSRRILTPLGETELSYGPLPAPLARQCAATGACPRRNRSLQGEVHDANAWVLGGRAGHAGLFGTAAAVSRLALIWLMPDRLALLDISPEMARLFVDIPPTGRPWAWDRTGPGASQAGALAPATAYGHLGFTGTSVWVDPAREVAITLLTNRVAVDADGTAFRRWRPDFYNLVWEVLDELLG